MFSGITPSALGCNLQRGQIDGNAVEAAVHVLPAIRSAVPNIHHLRTEIGRNKNVHNRQSRLLIRARRRGNTGGHGHHGHALIGGKTSLR